MGNFIVGQLASMAAGYVVTKVAGILAGSLWGQAVLAAVERRARAAQAERVGNAIDSTPKATDAERGELTGAQKAALDHED